MSGCRPNHRVAPPWPTTCVWVSSMARTVPVARVRARRASCQPGCGIKRWRLLVSAGSVRTMATSRGARARRRPSTSLNWAIRTLPGGGLRQPPLGGDELAVLQIDETLVEVAVVMAIEQKHDLAPGGGAGHPDRLDVSLACRQGELPERHRVAARQLFG